MAPIRDKIEKCMDEKADGEVFSFCGFLGLLSFIYKTICLTRNLFYQWRIFRVNSLSCKVISVGNLCVGGTGKTPMTVYVTKLLKAMGYRVCIISRGYKGKAEKSGGIVSDGDTFLMDAKTAGDEPYMMAGQLPGIPVIVGKNRYASGKIAVEDFKAQVIVLDDAFQHRQLFRDIDLVLLDYRKPFGNGRLLPAGRLREPLNALYRSDGIVFTHSKQPTDEEKGKIQPFIQKGQKECPVFFTSHRLYVSKVILPDEKATLQSDPENNQDIQCLEGKTVFAFSGIAHNHDFLWALKQKCKALCGFLSYPDHYPYTQTDIDDIICDATIKKADLIATTQKDDVKIPNDIPWPVPLFVIDIQIAFLEGEDRFKSFLAERLSI